LVVSICPYFFFDLILPLRGFDLTPVSIGLFGPFGIGAGLPDLDVGLGFGLILVGCLVAVGLVYPIPGRITS